MEKRDVKRDTEGERCKRERCKERQTEEGKEQNTNKNKI